MPTPHWQTSSLCQGASNCLGLALGPDGTVLLRESAEPDVIVTTTPDKLRAFILGIKAGEFDHLIS
ncbi:DUF397 domain-containing protein [Streptomyces sp. NPDC002055]|uniref:DUF397 domain-containing protein n=1 Tax=Streptomyces sp. NPDC002055 TaxID=3154534 RepID=UPI0033305FB8